MEGYKDLKGVGVFCEALLSVIPFGMEIVDAGGNILFANDKLMDIAGRDIVGKNAGKCIRTIRDNVRFAL
jgi:hypothetical protein